MEEMERDLVTFQDDDGNEFELEVIDYFEHEGEEYAILMELESDEEAEGEEPVEQDVFIMKVVVNGDMEEFLPADDDKMDALAAIAEELLSEGCGGCCGCGDEDEEEGGCCGGHGHHHHEGGCCGD